MVIPAKYGWATGFSEGIAFVKEGATGMSKAINSKEEVLFECNNYIPMPEGFKNGFARVKILPGKGEFSFFYNYIDHTGKLLLFESATGAEPFQYGQAVIKNKSYKKELIENTGKKVFSESFSHISFTDTKGYYYYSDNTDIGFGIISNQGKRVIEPKYRDFTRINDTLFMCKYLGGFYTLVSVNAGELIVPVSFTNHRWTKAGNKYILTLFNPNDALTGKLISLDFDPKTGKFLKEGKEIPLKDNTWLTINKKPAAKPVAPVAATTQPPTRPVVEEKETVVSTSNEYIIFKNSQGYYGVRDKSNNNLVFPAILGFADFKGPAGAFEVVLLGYKIERCYLGVGGFAGDMICDVCDGSGFVEQTVRLKGDRTKKVYKSYLGNGVWEEITVTTTEPDKNVTYNGYCKRCDRSGKMRGGIRYASGTVKIWNWKDELQKSRN